MIALLTELASIVAELLALSARSERDEQAELKAMMRASRLLHDEIARRMFGG